MNPLISNFLMTLLTGDMSVENITTIKSVLGWFELTSGLKVNFHKSKLVGIAMNDTVVRNFAEL